jgi:SAM-dependent methyltransferase
MDWHSRYLQQASWTRDLRSYLFEKAGLPGARRVLEVGCGTGAVIRDVLLPEERYPVPGDHHRRSACGIDIDPVALAQCRTNAPRAVVACADGLTLPFADQVFEIVYCHFFLLWARDPLAALLEMRRVAAKTGQILALAEPDYTLRIDEPSELASAGSLQTRSLQLEGADVSIGSRVADLFGQAGIRTIETGQIEPRPLPPSNGQGAIEEWLVLRSDLERLLSSDEVDRIQQLDAKARRRRTRRIHVPTYFAWGQV